MAVLNAIALLLLIGSLPIWAYRMALYAGLDGQAKAIFKRLCRRNESALMFGLRTFGLLVAFAAFLMLIMFGLSLVKYGSLRPMNYREVVSHRLYSGFDTVDPHIDAVLYNQHLGIMAVTSCLLLAIGLTVFLTPLRDIDLIKRLKLRLTRLEARNTPA